MNRSIIFLASLVLITGCNINNTNQETKLQDSSIRVADGVYQATLFSKKFLDADTVLLISHTGRQYKRKDKYVTAAVPPVLIDGKLNRSNIKKRVVIVGKQLEALSQILTSAITEETSTTTCIFDPHHTIVLIHGKDISYINICFRCLQFETSEDLKPLLHYDDKKWSGMEQYFKQLEFEF